MVESSTLVVRQENASTPKLEEEMVQEEEKLPVDILCSNILIIYNFIDLSLTLE